jgi:hypothetical protein
LGAFKRLVREWWNCENTGTTIRRDRDNMLVVCSGGIIANLLSELRLVSGLSDRESGGFRYFHSMS